MFPAKTVSIVCPENLRAGYKNIPEAEYDPAIHVLFDRETGKAVAPVKAPVASQERTIAKGPRGLWYVMDGDKRASQGYKDEAEARQALEG